MWQLLIIQHFWKKSSKISVKIHGVKLVIDGVDNGCLFYNRVDILVPVPEETMATGMLRQFIVGLPEELLKKQALRTIVENVQSDEGPVKVQSWDSW